MNILQKVNSTEITNVIVPKDLVSLKAQTGSIYKSLNIVIKRADQIKDNLRKEILDNLQEFDMQSDTFDEVQENKEQIELSRCYEKLPSASLIALHEFKNNELYYRDESTLQKDF